MKLLTLDSQMFYWFWLLAYCPQFFKKYRLNRLCFHNTHNILTVYLGWKVKISLEFEASFREWMVTASISPGTTTLMRVGGPVSFSPPPFPRHLSLPTTFHPGCECWAYRKTNQDGIRTADLSLARQTPQPLGHRGSDTSATRVYIWWTKIVDSFVSLHEMSAFSVLICENFLLHGAVV